MKMAAYRWKLSLRLKVFPTLRPFGQNGQTTLTASSWIDEKCRRSAFCRGKVRKQCVYGHSNLPSMLLADAESLSSWDGVGVMFGVEWSELLDIERQ